MGKKKAAKKSSKKVSASHPKPAAGPIKPLHDKVVVKPLSAEEAGMTTSFGIIIPETASKEKPEQGKVIAVGEGKYENGVRVPVSVKVGDRVLFSKYGYDEVKVGGQEYLIVSESNILAVINN